jgi:hypothetical protein
LTAHIQNGGHLAGLWEKRSTMTKLRMFMAIGIVGAMAPLAAQEAGVQYAPVQAIKEKLDAEKVMVEGIQRMAVEARVTTGAPYSGEAITESLQVLSDGNRIAKKTVSRIYRDSEGRTRREQLGADGQVESISISDPVAGVTYVLDPRTKVAHRNGVIMVSPVGVATASIAPGSPGVLVATKAQDGSLSVEAKAEAEGEAKARTIGGGRGRGGAATTVFTGSAGAGGGGFTMVAPAMGRGMTINMGKTTTEDLGSQLVDGVSATGSRSTTVIEAGAVGNDRAIQIVSEQWIATDLKVLLMTKHNDPRSGETSYRLTNVTQAEPSHALFEVPADYTLKESMIRRQPPALEK